MYTLYILIDIIILGYVSHSNFAQLDQTHSHKRNSPYGRWVEEQIKKSWDFVCYSYSYFYYYFSLTKYFIFNMLFSVFFLKSGQKEMRLQVAMLTIPTIKQKTKREEDKIQFTFN